MASDTYPLTLDEALARLLAMIGEPVDVRVMSVEPLGLIANFYGTLISRGDVRHVSRRAEGEVFEFFVARGDAGAEFYIDQRSFGGASYVDVDALGGPSGDASAAR